MFNSRMDINIFYNKKRSSSERKSNKTSGEISQTDIEIIQNVIFVDNMVHGIVSIRCTLNSLGQSRNIKWSNKRSSVLHNAPLGGINDSRTVDGWR